MNNKVLNYAKKQIEETDKTLIVLLDNHLYIQTSFGSVYKLAEDEIFSLAKNYLENEINSLEHI